MHSLISIGDQEFPGPVPFLDSGSRLAIDPDTRIAYLYVPCDGIYHLSLDESTVSWTTLLPLLEPLSKTISFDFIPESQALAISTDAGELYLVSVADSSKEAVLEQVGIVDSGIAALVWSPDYELLTIVTGNRTVLELTRDFQIVTEVALDTEAAGEDAQVQLGWGKKETQFHGSVGKQAAQAKTATEGLSEDDDFMPRLSWRGDGNFFVCSFVNATQTRRTLHVFNREGYLQNVSEPIALLEHTLDWKPSGNLIACSQKLSHKHDIVFFERNGLRHGEFSLRSNGAHVQGLKYNSDSTILGIHLIEADGSHVFQLWTMNNYYYYMKQSLKVPAGVQILQVVWDSELPLQLYLLTSDGHLLSKHFAFDILRSACLSPSHPGTVAVIDGTDLKLTFFKYQNVPPPMSSLGVSLSAPISFVSFCPFELGTRMVVMLNNGNAELFDTKGSSASDLVKMPQNVGSIRVPAHIRQLVWVHPVMLAGIQSMGDCDTVVLIHLTDTDGRLSVNGIEPVEFAFSSLLLRLTVTHDLRLICQDTEATVFQIAQDENGVPVVEQKAFFPKPCPWFTSTYVGPNRTEEVFIGLSERNSLYLEDKVLSPDCTSFALHDQFLVMTTLAHTTCFISLDLPRNDFVLENRPPSPLDESVRKVEIGSKIVTVTPGDIRLILQMPRGNLETINPRALVLSKICRALDASQFKEAFLACRKHRIDLNLLIDRNPQAFYSQIEEALTQINQPDYVNLLISGLKAEDVTKTMYASCHTTSASTANEKNVNDCCDLILNTLTKMDDKKYLLSILTAYAKKSPPDLGAAMSKILKVKKDSGAEAAESALRYLIFLADVNCLYDFALGVYDFPLVLMVAQHSQKDPREYLPFLNELQQLGKFHQRFVIDDHLSRFESALQNLNLAGEDRFEKCVSYIKKHDLYKFALTLFSPVEAKYQRVLEIYADELSSRGDAEESGILYSLAGKQELALEAYMKGLLWQEAFALAADMSLPQDKLKEMAFEMRDELVDQKRFKEAAEMMLEYGKSIEIAIEILAKGTYWSESLRLAKQSKRDDMLDNVIMPAAVKALDGMRADVSEMLDTFAKQKLRLAELQDALTVLLEALKNGVPDERLENIDIMSDTSSMATTFLTGSTRSTSMSARSNRTGKQRRKNERRRAAGKMQEFEDEYLITSLRKAIDKSNKMRGEMLGLLRFLSQQGRIDDAKSLQKQFGSLLHLMETSTAEIFVPQLPFSSVDEVREKLMNDQFSLLEPVVSIPPPEFSKAQWSLSFLD